MSQITIVDDALNFTKITAAPAERPDQGDDEDYSREDDRPETKQEEAQRIAHELTSILISGHLPQLK
jgi:hypothetical protein